MDQIKFENEHRELLFQIPLFKDLPANIRQHLLEHLDYQLYQVKKKECIASQGTPCKKLYVLLKGSLRTEIIDGLGNRVIIEYIIAPRTFATPHLFSKDATLPATFFAMEDSLLLTATKESTFKLISENPEILKNFLCITGNCNHCTVSRLKILSYKSIRERFLAYLSEHKRPNSAIIKMVHNKTQLADYLNVKRPALSKEINQMVKDGDLCIENMNVEILKKELLLEFL